MPGVWMLAAVSGDRDLAKTVAAPYRVPSPEQLHALSHIREYCLRHALAGDDEALAALGQKLEPGYPADFPPQFIEFPLGIIKSDPDMILSGLKKSNSRFRGKWDEKKWRAWYDEPRNRHRRPDTWEECAKANKDALFNLRFFLNWWALAWLNIASWCGMDEVFKNARSFSPWVPIELAAGRPS
jgi:hypothetical protein